MNEYRRNLAMAIKSCLESLAADASRSEMGELAHFIELAALAAEEAAFDRKPKAKPQLIPVARQVGHC